jgi:hypothetical protein
MGLNFPEPDYSRSIFVSDRLIHRVAVLGSVEVIPGVDSALELVERIEVRLV